jgi:ribosomal protein S18 acetylase RimI-like enzyme
MTGTMTQVDVVDVTPERLDEAVDVLACAFMNSPLIKLFYGGGHDYARTVRDAFGITCEARLTLGEYVKGVQINNRLVGVACIATPGEKQWPDELEQKFDDFAHRSGTNCMELLNQYGALTAPHNAAEPHFYLIALGVHPNFQGRGYGRRLLDEVQSLSEAHPTSTGVGLDTEKPSNVSFYEHCGYRVTAKTRLETVDIWCMFRADNA